MTWQRRNKELLRDDRWKKKGHSHKVKEGVPEVCKCKGLDKECPLCGGLGEIYRD